MPDSKDIQIRAKIDTSGVDQQLQSLQQKLNQMQRMSGVGAGAQEQYGAGSKMSQMSKAFFGDYNQESIRNLREAFNLNSRKLQHEARDMQRKEQEMRRLQKLDKDMTDAQRQRLQGLKDEIDLIKQKGRAMLEENQKIARQAEQMGSDLTGFKGVGARPDQQQQMSMWDRMKAKGGQMLATGRNVLAGMGGGSAMVGALGAGAGAAQIGAGVLSYQQTRDRQMLQHQADATRSANIEFQHMMQNRGFMNQFESGDRQKAMSMALEELERRKAADPWKAAAQIGGQATAGAAAGGFMFGPWGAVGGGLLGAGRAVLGDKGLMRQLFDPEAYQAELAADTFKNFQANLAANRAKDPGRYAAAETYQQRMQEMQQVQRALGVESYSTEGAEGEFGMFPSRDFERAPTRRTFSGVTPVDYVNRPEDFTVGQDAFGETYTETDEALERRMQERNTRNAQRREGLIEAQQRGRDGAGGTRFRRERIIQNINAILGAGGTSEFAGQAMGGAIAAEYQQMGLTQAPQQLGAISGTGLNAQQTESQFKKMFAEAIDLSNLSKNSIRATENTRRIMQTFTNMFTQSQGAEGAVEELGLGITGGGGMQIQGAMESFRRRSAEAGQGTGYRGALKWAYLNTAEGRKEWSGVSESLKSWATTAKFENLDVDSPMVQRILQQKQQEDPDITAEDVLGMIRNVQRSGEDYRQSTVEAREKMGQKYQEFLKKNKVKASGKAFEQFRRTEEGKEVVGDYLAKYYEERPDQAGQEKTISQISTAKAAATRELPKEMRDVTKPELKTPTKPKDPGDVKEASDAKDQLTQLTNMANYLEQLNESAKTNIDQDLGRNLMLEQLERSIQAVEDAVKSGGDPTQAWENLRQNFTPQTQEQSKGKKKKK
jgi:hypothetical protein